MRKINYPRIGIIAAALLGLAAAASAVLPPAAQAINNVAYSIPLAGVGTGATPYHFLSTASNNATRIKSTAGTVYSLDVMNTNVTTAYLHVYDKGSAAPTCGTDVPAHTYTLVQNVPRHVSVGSVGQKYANGIGFCITANAADTDNVSATTGIILNVDYK